MKSIVLERSSIEARVNSLRSESQRRFVVTLLGKIKGNNWVDLLSGAGDCNRIEEHERGWTGSSKLHDLRTSYAARQHRDITIICNIAASNNSQHPPPV